MGAFSIVVSGELYVPVGGGSFSKEATMAIVAAIIIIVFILTTPY
jgi:hypothetical protein